MPFYINKHINLFNVYKLFHNKKKKSWMIMIPPIKDRNNYNRNVSWSPDKKCTNEIKKEIIHDENKIDHNNDNNNNMDDISYKNSNNENVPNHNINHFNNNIICNHSISKNYKRILLIEKYTKYDNLKKLGYSDEYILKNFLRVYISHFTHTLILNNIIHLLRTKYKAHVSILKAYKKNIENIFISSSSVFAPDAIFSVGGDGTYLESAHIIANKYSIDKNARRENKRIELVGINSDPRGSEGKLCLDYFIENNENDMDCSYESFEEFEKLYNKKSKKKHFIFTDVNNFIDYLKKNGDKKNKIDMKTVLDINRCMDTDPCDDISSSENIDNKEISSQQELCSFRKINTIEDIVRNNSLSYNGLEDEEQNCTNGYDKEVDVYDRNKDMDQHNINININSSSRSSSSSSIHNSKIKNMEDHGILSNNRYIKNKDNLIISIKEYINNTLRNFFECNKHQKVYRKYITVVIKKSNEGEIRTYKSINEVYIYEAIKNNICTYINIDNKLVKKLKSTALLITSGTGSTAWAYNINKIDKKKMKYIIDEYINIQNDTIKQNIKNINLDLFSEYINNSICFNPNSIYMKCIVKEPVENSVYDSTDHIYNCRYIDIKTCTNNTIVYIDGIYNIKIQPNDSIILHIKDDDHIVTYK
ncbi:hypothetical protein PFBG_02465 [Plasmodium falciparum 7G8]|uniref:Uncharacterized protein n=3 Tax=Plasmodium falciparum TaxID=5833 RepID=A0A024WSL9_PLAFA|nr:hypothetical protein PFMALIP_02419 [Plasmodium falciparum MaliPS096_E11]EUR72371.1 hypothetical protein PFBG_02465 [Plasmodium falciparum 7G8]